MTPHDMPLAELGVALGGFMAVDLGIKHHFAPDGTRGYAKQMHLPAGTLVLSHSHPTDHASCLASGRVIVRTDESAPREFAAPDIVFIKAGLVHSIAAIEDSVWFCIHDIEVTDQGAVDDVILGRA